MNVSAMEDENRTIQYYLQDELGKPLRVLYRSGSGDAYGYDEFGGDLYDPEKKPGAGNRYSLQGERQPFGFTGYNMMTSAGHTLHRRGNISRVWGGLQRRISCREEIQRQRP